MREREWGEYIGYIKARERWKNYYLKKYRKEHFSTISRVQLKFISFDKYVSVGK